jgi:hypothetical protein
VLGVGKEGDEDDDETYRTTRPGTLWRATMDAAVSLVVVRD